MFPILQIGPLAIQFPGLVLLIGLWLGLEWTERHAISFDQAGSKLYTLVLIALAAGVIGARLVFAAQNPGLFEGAPLSLLSLSPQLLNLPGGIVAAMVAGFAYGQRRQLKLWPTLDALTLMFAVMAVAAAWANFASGDGYGSPTNVPWAIDLWGAMRHPSQLYEALAASLVVFLLWPEREDRLNGWLHRRPGARFWLFLTISAALRLFLEAFRGDSTLILEQFRLAQIISWLVLAIGLWNIDRLLPEPPDGAADKNQ